MVKKICNAKGIIFDFGGTLDTDGDHWGVVLWDVYKHFQLPVEYEDFRMAYIHGERALARQPLIQPHHHFGDVLRIKIGVQLNFLAENGKLSLACAERERILREMAGYAEGIASRALYRSTDILVRLARNYKLVLVSNFYGNIRTVLEDAGLLPVFEQIIESAVVGVRKPNPAIFALGVCALNLPPAEVVVVGDSFPKDIEPAYSLGCYTLWLKGRQWEEGLHWDESLPDAVLSHLSEVEDWL